MQVERWSVALMLHLPLSNENKNSFHFIPFSPAASTVVEQVEVVVGGDLELPCDVIPPIDDRMAVILWYRDNHPDAMYT